MQLTTTLLAICIASCWLPDVPLKARRLPVWAILFGAACCAALWSGAMDLRGIAWLVGIGLTRCISRLAHSRYVRGVAEFAVIALVFALGIRVLPGFAPSVFAEGIQVSASAPPMRLTFHFDQGAAGLFFLAMYCRRTSTFTEFKAVLGRVALVGGSTTLAVIGTAVLVGFVRFDPKLPAIAVPHLLKILLWTAVLEECFFRGILQERLSQASFIVGRPWLRFVPIALSSIAFGLVHAAGGALYVGLATIAGVGYSMAYATTRRIEAPILVHFLVNAVHFIGFTYPNLVQGKT